MGFLLSRQPYHQMAETAHGLYSPGFRHSASCHPMLASMPRPATAAAACAVQAQYHSLPPQARGESCSHGCWCTRRALLLAHQTNDRPAGQQ